MFQVLKNVIHYLKIVPISLLPVIAIAQLNSSTIDIQSIVNPLPSFCENDKALYSTDNRITLSVQTLFSENDTAITGDFLICINGSLRDFDNNQLLLKNAKAGFVIKNGLRMLTGLQASSITSTFKEAGLSDSTSTNPTYYYTFTCGPETMTVPLEKLSIHFENGLLQVRTSQLFTIDDRSRLCRLYIKGYPDSSTISLNDIISGETKEHFHTKTDTIYRTSYKSQNANLDSDLDSISCSFFATRADFWFDKNSNGKYWMIRLSSSEDTMSGPLLKNDVMNPRYYDKEFSIETQLEKPVFLIGPEARPFFYIDWNKTGKRNKLLISKGGMPADYCGWKLRLHQCSLTPGGITLDSFDIKMPYPFSDENDSSAKDAHICGFSGLNLSDFKNFDNLTIYGSASATPQKSLRITSSRGYIIEKIEKCIFAPHPENKEYTLQIIRNGILHLPSSKNRFFNEKSDVLVKIDTLEFGSGDILRLRAEGTITKTFGDATSGKAGTIKPLLALHGKILVRYLARDFQLYVNPQEGKPLFSFPAGGLFDNEASIGLPKGSIGLFSDGTINTLYIKGEFNKDKTVTPIQLEKRVRFKVPGVDVMQTNDGPQLILHAPKAAFFTGKTQSEVPRYYEIDQVMLDMNKKIKAVNGNLTIGENEPDPISMLLPESIQKSFSFKTEDISIGSKQPKGDSSIQLQINSIKTILSFNEPFKSVGLYGFRLPLERLRIISTPVTSWYLDCIDGRSINLMQFHYIKRSAVQTKKTKTAAADTSDPVFLTFNSYGYRVSSDTVSGGIMITIPQSNLEVTGSFPFKPVRKFSSFQDIKIIVKKENPFPQFVKFNSEIKKSPAINIGNLEFKNTETWFGTDSILNNSNTSCSNLFLGFSFKELLKDSVSLYSVSDSTNSCILNIYLDGSWRIAHGDIMKTMPNFPVLLNQCILK